MSVTATANGRAAPDVPERQQRPNIIEVRDVRKSFGDVKALRGVDMTVEEGTIVGLLGPNGAGKTTLVRVLTTLLKPDTGSVMMGGIDVLSNPEAVRRVFGLAGQYPAVDEQLTGRENLVMVGRLYHMPRKLARQRAEELLQRFSLVDAANRPVKTYSGGMRRRLDLAASIVAKPRILILDEPTTGLDPRTRIDLWTFIRELVRDGATLLLTTQYLEEADALADRIVVIDHGEVIADGTSQELKAQLASDFVDVRFELGTDMDAAAATLSGIGKGAPEVNENTRTVTLPVESGPKSLPAVVRAIDSAGLEIMDLSLRRPSLDDVFLKLTGQRTETQEAEAVDVKSNGRRRSRHS